MSVNTAARRRSVIPGFGLTMGLTLLYLGLLVLIPLSTVFFRSAGLSFSGVWQTVTDPRVLASFKLSFGASFFAATINLFFGFIVAWVLVRYQFPGRRLLDGLVDLPFALPTAVAGIALTAIYAETGWIGGLLEPYGIRVAFTYLGVVVALTFIGLPFVVRSVQPVLEDLEAEIEEAASSLGASRLQIIFRVVLPYLFPSVLTGYTLAFARALGEFGSVVFISGNMPFQTEIAPLLIMIKLEQYQYEEAAAIAAVMLIISFLMILIINLIQWWSRTRQGNE